MQIRLSGIWKSRGRRLRARCTENHLAFPADPYLGPGVIPDEVRCIFDPTWFCCRAGLELDPRPSAGLSSQARRVGRSASPGGTDIVARTFSQTMSELLCQTIVINDKAGAATNFGADYAAKAKSDG